VSSSEFDDVGNRWFAAMRTGDFAEAWRQTDRIELERRAREAAGTFSRQPHHLAWNGAAFEGRHVLVRCNHGLGDTLQFIRFIPLLRRRTASVTLLIQPQLVKLFAGCVDFGVVRNGWTDEPPPYEVEIEIMELAYAFRSTVQTLPRRVPYLPLAQISTCAFPSLGVGDCRRVGLIWAASDWDTSRSIPIEALAPLRGTRGIEFYSLQQGKSMDESRRAAFPINCLSQHTADATAAAAAMLKLDLIISVDSMAAHLAGALGRPVWLLLQHEADWRWMTDRSDSPWYPTMRIFRQHRRGDWLSVAQTVTTALQEFAHTSCTRVRARRSRRAHSRA
jgi:hypothetical protein